MAIYVETPDEEIIEGEYRVLDSDGDSDGDSDDENSLESGFDRAEIDDELGFESDDCKRRR